MREPTSFVPMALLAISCGLAITVIIPRRRGPRAGLIFWEAIAGFPSGERYAEEALGLKEENVTKAILEHSYDLAKVCQRKYNWLFWGSFLNDPRLLCFSDVSPLLWGLAQRSPLRPGQTAKPALPRRRCMHNPMFSASGRTACSAGADLELRRGWSHPAFAALLPRRSSASPLFPKRGFGPVLRWRCGDTVTHLQPSVFSCTNVDCMCVFIRTVHPFSGPAASDGLGGRNPFASSLSWRF
jgi:hypothetical protein